MTTALQETPLQWNSDEVRSLLDVLDAQQRAPQQECREHVRSACRRSAVFIAMDEEGPGPATPSHLVQVRNISQSGLCFLDRSVVPVGTPCRIDMRLRPDWIKRNGHVVRSRLVDLDVFEVAVAFHHALTDEELAQVV
jgi:hypothetical protein